MNYIQPSTKDIKTSIVIVTFNNLEYLKACIESIRTFTQPQSYEIIVVDQGSPDGTAVWLKEKTDIISIFNDENSGFPEGCNQGIKASTGDSILLLNQDTLVTYNWLNILLDSLYSSEDIGAVGPVNNLSYNQSIVTGSTNLDEVFQFARQYNNSDPSKWELRLKLVKVCMLIKRVVIEKIGMLDERFYPGLYDEDDYSFRIMQAGYKLVVCKDVFIYQFGMTTFSGEGQDHAALLHENEKKFEAKWGFNARYSTFIRQEIIKLMDVHEQDEKINVLEVGCACGGTLLQIKNVYKNAELYGIELSESSAAIASLFANVIASDVEKDLSYPEELFDYIILPDVLEHLYNPWQVLKNLKRYLKKRGKILSSIPNIMHYSVLGELLNGRFTYTDAGLLDRTHVRFFTMYEIEKMFLEAGYYNLQYDANFLKASEKDEQLVEALAQIGNIELKNQFKVYQYLVKAHKFDARSLDSILQQIELDQENNEGILKMVDMINQEQIIFKDIIESVNRAVLNKQNVYNYLAIGFYNNGLIEDVLPLLQQSLQIDAAHKDTLFNISHILYSVGEKELALHYLEQIKDDDIEVIEFIKQVRSDL
jgi:GT2 family glycosyltransferase/ubiquinone/menaquinone biosynthesis C-methylase UbiE